MRKHISKFEAFDSSSLHGLFKDHNLKVSDLNNMINRLEKYNLDPVLISELKKSKERDYRDLRKWKIDSIILRYDKANKIIERAEIIEDYFLELTDNGYRIKLFPYDDGDSLFIYTKGVNKSRLDKIAEVSGFLQHLNNTHRLNVELVSIHDSNEFKVIIRSVVEDPTKKVSQDEDEDYDAHRIETEHERTLRYLRRIVNPHTFDTEDADFDDPNEDE